MSDEPQGPARTIVGNFEITLNLTQSRGIKMLGYVYSDDTPKELNARIDGYQDALDRQAVRVDITSKEAQIAMHRINVEAMNDDYDATMRLQQSGKKLTSQQQLRLRSHAAQLDQAKKMIESLDAAIRAGREKLAAT